MNSDFSLKKFQWKKIIAFALCMLMLVPQTAVIASDNAAKMEVVVNAKGSSSGNAYYVGSVTNDDYSFVYTGKAIKPVVYVKVASSENYKYKTLAKNYYTVKCGKFNSKGKFKATSAKAVGVYYAQISFKDKYKNITPQYVRFEIRPQTIKIKSIKAKGRKATVRWNKLAKSAVTKYEVGVSAKAVYKNDQHTDEYVYGKYVKNTASSHKFSKMGSGNKNYVRVRAYKEVKYYTPWGYQEENTLYGDWSKAATATFK